MTPRMSAERLAEIERLPYDLGGNSSRPTMVTALRDLLAELREVTRERDEARVLAAKNEQDWREAREARWAFLERKIEAAEQERDKLKVDMSYLQDEHRDLERDYDALERERDEALKKLEWEVAVRNALSESQERLAAEVERLKKLNDDHARIYKMVSDEDDETIDALRAENARLREAIKKTIARADDYGDSHLSQPVRAALDADKGKGV